MEITIKSEKIIIRQTKKSDAKSLIEYLNMIGGESDYIKSMVFRKRA